MAESNWAGLAAVVAGGLLQGAFMLPMKWTKRWAWENTWLIFACTAYLICPWLLILTTTPQALDVYRTTGAGPILLVMLFGVGWGLGAVTFGLGVDALGLALGFALILGVAACAGALVPIWLSPTPVSSAKLSITIVALLVMLGGVALCSFAGRWKEQQSDRRTTYAKGVLICLASGLLSACGNVGFAFGQPIIDRAQAAGVPQYFASNVVWALLTVALFLCNASYAIRLLVRNGTAAKFKQPGAARYFGFGVLMGAMWMGGFVFYGAGARRLGQLGPSLGWAILMSAMVLTANALGVATGEWRDAPRSATRTLAAGIICLLAAIVLLGYGNSLH
jgi:L-rhamnose-H+ transport protein